MSVVQRSLTTRPLQQQDFDQVVNIDASISGRRRPGFFEKRLMAALVEPKYFVYIGCEHNGKLKGFLLARLLTGEYGTDKPIAVLDAIGVDPDNQGHGFGRAMLQEFEAILRHKGVGEIQSQADWRNRSILQFFADIGFKLAPRQILEREVSYMPAYNPERESGDSGTDEGKEIDYSQPDDNTGADASIGTVICRSMQQEDLPAIIRIDEKVMGYERRDFHERKLAEVLDETGIRVSMVGEIDGFVVGFIMARVDFGEFDRTEPTAVLDIIAVDPDFSQYHTGSALLSQLLGNLSTLRLDRIRTEIGADHFDVLSFLMKNEFSQSQQLAFSYTLG